MINQEVFDKLLDIGGPQLARRVIDLFFEHTPEKLRSLQAGLEQGDCKTVERAAHSIKSSAANLGLEDLRQIASELELAGHNSDLEACRQLGARLAQASSRAEALLQDKRKELETA